MAIIHCFCNFLNKFGCVIREYFTWKNLDVKFLKQFVELDKNKMLHTCNIKEIYALTLLTIEMAFNL